MKKLLFTTLAAAMLVSSCGNNNKQEAAQIEVTPIMEKALNDNTSKFYANFPEFPAQQSKLPIGVFDSGTGGLTVLEVLLNADMIDNISGKEGGDGVPDFAGEAFTYLADRANMPYGNYAAENKQDFFRELVVKDALFLLDNKYWTNPADKVREGAKQPCKILVIACNTATAWGLQDISNLLKLSGTGVKVIGVINAGVNALYNKLETANTQDSVAVGVLATV
ncbi:MAG: aspartate/glutamate racemase family protein, partial [Bacteroidales bacterium]|nr:aspartate/glutamate racemase family protein [Bacteroidales bacterium]